MGYWILISSDTLMTLVADTSKDPGPENPALVHPEGVCHNTNALVE